MTAPANLYPKLGAGVPQECYHLNPEYMAQLESGLVAELRESGASGVVTVATESYVGYSDFVRTQETRTFTVQMGESYDFHEGMEPYEKSSLFLMTVDLDLGVVAHTKRLVAAKPEGERVASGLTGIEIFDDRLTSDRPEEQCDLDSILRYHGISDVEGCINVTTNMVTQRAPLSREKPYSMISYKAVFELAQLLGASNIVAYQNVPAMKSLGKFGVEYDLLLGREFHLPTTSGGYDESYLALVIPASEHNVRAFTQVNPELPLTSLIADRDVPIYYKRSDDEPIKQIF